MPDPEFEILYQSGNCLGVVKPAGLATQAPPGIESLETRIKSWLASQPGFGPVVGPGVYLGVPHRLDRPVSGAMVFATHPKAARRLSMQFERRQVRKLYWACVEGRVEPAEGTWTDYLLKVYGHPRAEVVAADHPGARLAVLHYRTLGSISGCTTGSTTTCITAGTWLEITLETGRTHQVRIQAASRGHPVVGDTFYGGTIAFGEAHRDERLRAIALHGRSLAFRDPDSREPVEIVASLPSAWYQLGLPLPL